LKLIALVAMDASVNANAALNELDANLVLLGRQRVPDLLHLRVGLRQQVGVEVLASGERSLNVLNGQRQKRISSNAPIGRFELKLGGSALARIEQALCVW
jgi:hypothetical protein